MGYITCETRDAYCPKSAAVIELKIRGGEARNNSGLLMAVSRAVPFPRPHGSAARHRLAQHDLEGEDRRVTDLFVDSQSQ